jgi:outer membrane lipoprotein-sorting protein
MKRMLVVGAALVLMMVAGGSAQASGTPLAFIITTGDSKPIVVLVNFNSEYSDALISSGTSLLQSLMEEYASSLDATVVVMTAEDFGGMDADSLHNSVLSLLGDFQIYLYAKATKVNNAESGSNLRFDFRMYTSRIPIGLYVGALEVDEYLLTMFL